MTARVAWISIAPVKGLGLVHPDEVALEPFGVPADRRFHLVGAEGELVNGKRIGRLVQIEAGLDEEGRRLSLLFPDGAVVAGAIALGEPVTTVFYGRPVEGRLVLGPFSRALSAWAGRPLHLVQPERPCDAHDRGRSRAVSLLSTAALDALAVAAGTGERVDGRRFRMLFGVDGIEAHEEDGWLDRRVRIGEAVVIPRGKVGRCAVTTHDPDAGEPDLDTLRALKQYRGEVPTVEPLPFGVCGEVATPGRVRVGDPVELLL